MNQERNRVNSFFNNLQDESRKKSGLDRVNQEMQTELFRERAMKLTFFLKILGHIGLLGRGNQTGRLNSISKSDLDYSYYSMVE